METLEQSRVCRLCGKQAGLTIKIFDKRGNHVKKINSVLPIVVHEMDLLPKHMCRSCNFKLQEFHKFYEDCLKTDADLKSQLSWMQGSDNREEIILPMVQISNVQIKSEPLDYDEQESTEVIFNNENITNFVPRNCTTLPERIFQSTRNKCSRCGCYCGNRNRVNDDAKNCSKTRPNRHNGVKKSNEVFPARDTIRRNLFATEIFGHKNPKIQTEIPICNISREMLKDPVETKEILSEFRLERLGSQQNGVAVKTNNKMAFDPGEMSAHNLRPRKRCISHSLSSVSLAGVIKRPKGRSNKNITERASNAFATIEIKREASEDCARSLRPRMEAIDYSDSKRKNPMARVNVLPRRTRSPDVRRKISSNSTRCTKNMNVESTAKVTVKVENERFDEISKIRKSGNNLKMPLLPTKSEKESPGMTFKAFLNGLTGDDVSSKKCFDRSKSRTNRSKNRMSDVSKRKNFETNHRHTSFYLRSQRGHLRNGKLKEFDSLVQKPKKNQQRNTMADSTKRKQRQDTEKSSSEMIFKYRDCYTCNARFASSELYKLHGCYANQWR